MDDSIQQDLIDRREKRYVCEIQVKVIPLSFFSSSYVGEVVDISSTGVSLLTNRSPSRISKARLEFEPTIGPPFNVDASVVWVDEQAEYKGYYSGWKFHHIPGGARRSISDLLQQYSNLGRSLPDRRSRLRRATSLNVSQNYRKQARRLSDALDGFDLLGPSENLTYRRNGDRRRIDRRQKLILRKRDRRKIIDDRRASSRRSIYPANEFNDEPLKRAVQKSFSGLRDFLVFWLPPIMARKLVKERSFAFIAHPRDTSDVSRQYPFAKYLPETLLNFWLKWQWPVIGAEIKGIKRSNGSQSNGWLIFCPLTAKQMVRDRSLARKKVLDTVKFAKKVGARIVGLGAFTSIVTRDGFDISENVDIGVTTGNALSAAVAIQNAVKAAQILQKSLSDLTVAIVGAAGNVGSGCARSIAGRVKKLILVDINKRALDSLITELRGTSTEVVRSSVPEIVQEADIVIAVTNSPGAILRAEHFKHRAIVIDCAQPKNVSAKIPDERPDVIVIESAILSVPEMECQFDLGIAQKEALGCMAELMILDSIGWRKHYSLGKLPEHQIKEIMAVAKALGIDITHFRNSKGYVTEEHLNRGVNSG